MDKAHSPSWFIAVQLARKQRQRFVIAAESKFDPNSQNFAEPNRTKSNSELFRERATEELEII